MVLLFQQSIIADMRRGWSGGVAAGGLRQVFQQMTASGHLVRIGRVAGQGAQHARQDFAALLVETGVLWAGSRSACAGNAANRGGRGWEKWWLGHKCHS
jgi:hypothetical protein